MYENAAECTVPCPFAMHLRRLCASVVACSGAVGTGLSPGWGKDTQPTQLLLQDGR